MKHRIVTQGHWWINSLRIPVRKPGFLKIEFDFQQKYPDVWTAYGERDLLVIVGHRPDQEPRGLRDGEDGHKPTSVQITLPRSLPWKRWNITTDQGRYSAQIVAWTEGSLRYEISNWLWIRKTRRRARANAR